MSRIVVFLLLMVAVATAPATSNQGAENEETKAAEVITADFVCQPNDYVELDSKSLGEIRTLSRNTGTSEEENVTVFSLKPQSRIWQTRCAVELAEQPQSAGNGCRSVPIMRSGSILQIAPLLNGRYVMHISNLNLPAGGNVAAILEAEPVGGKAANSPHTGWLKSSLSTLPDFQFFVYFGTAISGGKLIKNYIVEAFHLPDQGCISHRPENSLCKHKEADSKDPVGKDCPPTLISDVVVYPTQTNTGSGNENQGIP